MILRSDPDLPGMLMAQNIMESENTGYCQIYARLVLGHENERDCDEIVKELIGEGFKVGDGTCR